MEEPISCMSGAHEWGPSAALSKPMFRGEPHWIVRLWSRVLQTDFPYLLGDVLLGPFVGFRFCAKAVQNDLPLLGSKQGESGFFPSP